VCEWIRWGRAKKGGRRKGWYLGLVNGESLSRQQCPAVLPLPIGPHIQEALFVDDVAGGRLVLLLSLFGEKHLSLSLLFLFFFFLLFRQRPIAFSLCLFFFDQLNNFFRGRNIHWFFLQFRLLVDDNVLSKKKEEKEYNHQKKKKERQLKWGKRRGEWQRECDGYLSLKKNFHQMTETTIGSVMKWGLRGKKAVRKIEGGAGEGDTHPPMSTQLTSTFSASRSFNSATSLPVRAAHCKERKRNIKPSEIPVVVAEGEKKSEKKKKSTDVQRSEPVLVFVVDVETIAEEVFSDIVAVLQAFDELLVARSQADRERKWS
jgi:hypothetical protein